VSVRKRLRFQIQHLRLQVHDFRLQCIVGLLQIKTLLLQDVYLCCALLSELDSCFSILLPPHLEW